MIALFYFALQLLYSLALLGLTLFKLVLYGLVALVIHYTNWSIVWLALFFALTLAFFVPRSTCANVRCAGYVVALCYLPLLASVVFVLVAVYALLLVDDEFIERFFEQHEAGEVIFANSILHFVPVLSFIVYSFVQRRLVVYGLKLWMVPASDPARSCRLCVLVSLFVYWTFGGLLIVFTLYLIVLASLGLTLGWVYVNELPASLAVAGAIVTGLLVNGSVLAACHCAYGLAEPFDDIDAFERSIRYTDYELKSSGALLSAATAKRR